MGYEDVLSLAAWPRLPQELDTLRQMVLSAERIIVPAALDVLLRFRVSDIPPNELNDEFRLPHNSVGVDLSPVSVFFQDKFPDQRGLGSERVFLDCWPTFRIDRRQPQNATFAPALARTTGIAFMIGEIKSVKLWPDRPIDREMQGRGIIRWFGTWFPADQDLDMCLGDDIPREDKERCYAEALTALKLLVHLQFCGSDTNRAKA